STLERNLSANASSRKPNTTLTLFSHPPDLGRDFSMEGKKAKRTNGMAKAIEKPSIPMAGPNRSPLEAASTSSVPMIGPVQEKDTSARLKAIKNSPSNPPLSDCASILLTKELGKVSSKAPKKEAAKITSIRKNRKLKTPLVDRALSSSEPKAMVISIPSAT